MFVTFQICTLKEEGSGFEEPFTLLLKTEIIGMVEEVKNLPEGEQPRCLLRLLDGTILIAVGSMEQIQRDLSR